MNAPAMNGIVGMEIQTILYGFFMLLGDISGLAPELDWDLVRLQHLHLAGV